MASTLQKGNVDNESQHNPKGGIITYREEFLLVPF